MAMISDYLRNKIVDWILRAQTYSPVATHYVGLMTSNATHSSAGTEVSGGAYARVAITASMTATGWAGTQGAGTTVASTGSGASAVTSNNGTITFPAPSGANWGVVTGWIISDASTAGNLLFYGPLSVSKTINNGDAAPSFASGALALTFDT